MSDIGSNDNVKWSMVNMVTFNDSQIFSPMNYHVSSIIKLPMRMKSIYHATLFRRIGSESISHFIELSPF
jgi:hypothetical protein